MAKRSAGILIPLFSLRADRDLGRGDIGDLAPMLDLALAMGHRIVQLLPLDETGPGEASPYSASSVMAVDPIYIAVDELPGVSRARIRDAKASLGSSRFIARERVRQVKLDLLTRAYQRFRRGSERSDFEAYEVQNSDWLPDYALFRALKDRFAWAAWESWPEGLRNRTPEAIASARVELARPIEMYSYWQYVAHRQLVAMRREYNRRGAMIGGDLAFSPGRDSAEVWAHQDHFDLSRLVGAPPDAFSPDGQRWGLPMPDWRRMRAAGWSILRMRMRRARELYDVVRIDHVVGLFRTFSFGADPTEPGRFDPAAEPSQRDQGDSIMRAIVEEAGGSSIIAEDLGVVPHWVNASLTAIGIPGYKVIRWEKERGSDGEHFIEPSHYPELSLATTGTHDTETFIEWWREIPAVERQDLVRSLGLDGAVNAARTRLTIDGIDAIIEKLYASPSIFVIEPIQDLFGWSARINRPGTVGPSNWNYRLPLTLERMHTSGAIARRVEKLRSIARLTGRFEH